MGTTRDGCTRGTDSKLHSDEEGAAPPPDYAQLRRLLAHPDTESTDLELMKSLGYNLGGVAVLTVPTQNEACDEVHRNTQPTFQKLGTIGLVQKIIQHLRRFLQSNEILEMYSVSGAFEIYRCLFITNLLLGYLRCENQIDIDFPNF